MRGCLPGVSPSSGAYRATSPQGGRLFRRDEVTPPYIAILPQSFLPRPYPINVRARRALRIYYLLFLIYYLNCPSPAKPHPPHISPGILPRPKNAPPGRFCPAVRETRDLDLRLPHRTAPLDVACSLRPLRLLRFPVPAAGGGHLRSKLFSSPMVHLSAISWEIATKKHPATSCEVSTLVHHIGVNSNTFVYPGGIGITQLLTRK